jgi:shikimate O-hydroxycinnamoyltransferase
VTFLKSGGVVLGTALHHAAIDASSAFHFFQTWSAFCKHGDRAAVELPCHDRTLLRARSPPTVHPDTLLTLQPRLTLSDLEGPLAIEVFTISKDQVASLKHLCGGTSTFCAVSALIWQCACVARRLPPDSQVRLVFQADLRRRMRPPLPSRYFGSAVFSLYVTGQAGDIGTEALGSVATRIKGAIQRMDDELVRSTIDYFEMNKRERDRL